MTKHSYDNGKGHVLVVNSTNNGATVIVRNQHFDETWTATAIDLDTTGMRWLAAVLTAEAEHA